MHSCSFKYIAIIWNVLIGQILANFIGVKFLRAHSRFYKKRKKNLSSSIYVFYRTSRLELLLVSSFRKILLQSKGNTNLRSGPILAVLIYSLARATAKNWLFTKRNENWTWSSQVKGTRLFGSFQRKISGRNGTSGKVVLFFRTEYSKRKFIFYFFKPSSIPFVCIGLDNPPSLRRGRLEVVGARKNERARRRLACLPLARLFFLGPATLATNLPGRLQPSFRDRFSANGTDLFKW